MGDERRGKYEGDDVAAFADSLTSRLASLAPFPTARSFNGRTLGSQSGNRGSIPLRVTRREVRGTRCGMREIDAARLHRNSILASRASRPPFPGQVVKPADTRHSKRRAVRHGSSSLPLATHVGPALARWADQNIADGPAPIGVS